MRRLARILGVIGGIGAILWAMRDRLVSVAIPREPQLPAFRVPESPSGTPEPASTVEEVTAVEPASPSAMEEDAVPPSTPPSVTEVTGIGPVYATRLAAAGIATLSDLARSTPETIGGAAGVPVGRAEGWIQSARTMLEA